MDICAENAMDFNESSRTGTWSFIKTTGDHIHKVSCIGPADLFLREQTDDPRGHEGSLPETNSIGRLHEDGRGINMNERV